MVAFSCCVYDGGEEETNDMRAAREKGWKGKFTKPGRVIRPGAIRINGKCPLTPLEVISLALFLHLMMDRLGLLFALPCQKMLMLQNFVINALCSLFRSKIDKIALYDCSFYHHLPTLG